MHSLAFDMLCPRGLNGNYFTSPTEINKTNQHNQVKNFVPVVTFQNHLTTFSEKVIILC